MTNSVCDFMNSYWSSTEMNPHRTSMSLLTQDLTVRSLGSSGRSLMERLEHERIDVHGTTRADELASFLQIEETVNTAALEAFLEWTHLDDEILLIGLAALASRLDHTASRLSLGYPSEDAISEVLTHATMALRWTHEVVKGDRINFVLSESYSKARAAKRRMARHNVPTCPLRASDDPCFGESSWSHYPNGLLAFAVEQCVITRDDAYLIDATRLQGRALSDVAAEKGLSYAALHKRRERAEECLRRYFTVNGDVR